MLSQWWKRYAVFLTVSDAVIIVVAIFGAQLIRFSDETSAVSTRDGSAFGSINYTWVSALLIIGWLWALSLAETRSYRVIGAGATEYSRVARASVGLFGTVAIAAFGLHVDLARGYLLLSMPAGLFGLLIERWLWRSWLNKQRRNGRYTARVLLVGAETSVNRVADRITADPLSGLLVVGACVPQGKPGSTTSGEKVEILGSYDDVPVAMESSGADTVIVTSSEKLPAAQVKRISWGLEAGKQHLMLSMNITDIAGPRLHIRPVLGLPLMHVETPRFTRGQLVIKRMLGLILSLIGLIILSPVFLFIAIAIKISSPGPVLFKQVRIGREGRKFKMLKFRSMVVDAEARLKELQAKERDAGNTVMFKMADDPRITPIGKFLRRYSLDELPQILNVIGGSMDVVGPRPPLPQEVEQYHEDVHRRFLVKPGITGLWQVSGRSKLSWEETVRLDLSYVENWSIAGDLLILAKTARAVIGKDGAY
jgi:exopolysaccharide biosynthesis polyprenyl glycosylphosphotransferase